jgi:hypothetical protein
LKPGVHILAHVRKPELLPAALLVFRTLRTGFPESHVMVWGNALAGTAAQAVEHAARGAGAEFRNLPLPGKHDGWVEDLIQTGLEPFWICDTDIIFWEAVEDWRAPTFMGRLEPEFDEEWTKTRHMERLHSSLMYINPAAVRAEMRRFMAKIPAPFGHTARFPFVQQHFVPLRGQQPLFYDTCAGMWHAFEGQPFTEQQNRAYEHLHCATYADLIELEGLQDAHAAIYSNPTLARGMRETQDAYYNRRKPKDLICHTHQE